MDKLTVSVLENVFEEENISMNHIAMIGKKGSGKTELIKQIVGSFLQSGKKILWIEPSIEEQKTMTEKWNGFNIMSRESLKKEAFSSHSLILLETMEIDFEMLRTILIEDENEWVIVHDNLDELAINYELNDLVTRKLEFLYYLSEFGKVFNLYTLTAGQDLKTLLRVLPAKKIVDNSKNLLLLEQDYPSLKFIKKQKWLNEEQIEKVKNLPKYEAFFLRR